MQYDEFHCQLTMDKKGRITLPSPLRQALADKKISSLVAVANQGKRGGLSFFSPDDYRAVVRGRVRGKDPFARSTTVYLRAIDSTSQSVSIDANGRVLIPPMLRKLAGLERDVVAFSSMDWFEVWDSGRWDAAFEAAMELWDEQMGGDGLSSLPAAPAEEEEA